MQQIKHQLGIAVVIVTKAGVAERTFVGATRVSEVWYASHRAYL